MKPIYCIIVLLLMSNVACKQKILAGKDLEDKLKSTMADHLHKTLQPGTEFKITDLVYYADKMKESYLCTFKVELHTATKDTIGEMKAIIPNDFSSVDRTQ